MLYGIVGFMKERLTGMDRSWSTSSNNQKDLLLHITVCSNAFLLWVFLFLSEVSACIESTLLSSPVLSIFWQYFGSLRKGSQPVKIAKAETGVGGEGWGKRDQEFSQPVSQGDSASSKRSGISQPIFDKQMNSATELQSASFYWVPSWERDDLTLP